MEQIDKENDAPATYETKYKYLIMAFKQHLKTAKKNYNKAYYYGHHDGVNSHMYSGTFKSIGEIIDEMISEIEWLEGEEDHAV